MDPFSRQEGGTHYKSMKIQPVEFILANELGFCEGNVVKYICRYKQKGGAQDLKKVIHYTELLIKSLEADKSPEELLGEVLKGHLPDQANASARVYE